MDDIAREAGVSASTVSRVMSGHPSISESTRRRVLATAARLDYRKRPYSSGASAPRDVAGIIIPDMTSDYYARLVDAVNERFHQKSFSILLGVTNFDTREMIHAVEQMARSRVRCLLIIVDDAEDISETLLDTVRKTMLPAMFITSRYISTMDVDCLFVDERRGNAMAVEHLLYRGYRQIGFLGELNTANRRSIFLNTMQSFDVSVNPDFVRMGSERGELGGFLRMREILSLPELPDAIYASYDQMAIGALHAIREAGLCVPRDIAVIGFDDISAARYISGGLTTIGTPFDDMAAIAVRILTHRIATPYGQPQQIAIKPVLLARATT